jgi:putative peptidoglycan lipid II flippase
MATTSLRQPVSRDTALMAVGTALSRLTGFGRLFAIAYALGTAAVADSYNLANQTPNIVFDFVLGGVLSATLIPVFVDRLATRARREAWAAISSVVTLAAVILVVITVAFVLLAPLIIDLYTIGSHVKGIVDERVVATYLLRLFAPQVALYGFIVVATALLNTRRSFAAPMFVPVLNNLVVICMLLGLSTAISHPTVQGIRDDQAYLLVLGLGTTLGVLVQALALAPSLLRAGVRVRWRWDPRHEAVTTILRLSGWTFGFVVANQVALFVMLALASHTTGGLSAWTYAYMFFQLPNGIIAVSIMVGIQPEMAERWSLGDHEGFSHHVASGLRATIATLVPAAVGYIVLAKPLVALVLGHGAAQRGGILLTAQVLTMFALGLPGFSVYLFLMRAFQSMQDTRSAFYLYLLENGLNVALGFALFSAMGVKGLALSLSIAYTASSFAALVHLRRRTGHLHGRSVLVVLLRSVVLSAVMGAVVTVLVALVGSDHGAGALVRVVVGVVSGVSIFFVGAAVAAELAHRRRRPLAG